MQYFFISTGLFSVLSLFFNQFVCAEVVPDNTLNSKVTVSPDRSQLTITGGSSAHTNLFHSFDRFSVETGQRVVFAPDSTIANVITRVTGNSISQIDGAIALNGSANLFLLNPNGIVFGRMAQLLMNGSFIASTAERATFSDGSAFSVKDSQPPLLTLSTPMGLQFGVRPGKIVNQVMLNGAPGQTLALLGGDIAADRSNGGNLAIQTGVLLAVPNENSDITANAENGRGGTITINAQTILGLEQRLKLSDRSDITAVSGIGLDRTVTLRTFNQPALTPELSAIDTTTHIAQTCSAKTRTNRFMITGRGGIAPDLAEMNRTTSGWIDQRTPAQSPSQTAMSPAEMVEATHWIKQADGTIALVAEQSNANQAANNSMVCQVNDRK